MNARRICSFIAVVFVLCVIFSPAVFASGSIAGLDDSAAVAKTMRAYQSLYRYLYTSELIYSYTNDYQYVPWPGNYCGGADAPAYPPDDFYEYNVQSEDGAIALVKAIAHIVKGTSYNSM